MYTPHINHPTVNHTITQDPYTKEYTINIAIKIKPDTLIKEILTSARPSSYSDIAPLGPVKPLDLTNLKLSDLKTQDWSFLNKSPLPAITPAQLEAFGKNQDNMSLLKNPYL
jgi:hypothetical protein